MRKGVSFYQKLLKGMREEIAFKAGDERFHDFV
jgi:hypothetical protein